MSERTFTMAKDQNKKIFCPFCLGFQDWSLVALVALIVESFVVTNTKVCHVSDTFLRLCLRLPHFGLLHVKVQSKSFKLFVKMHQNNFLDLLYHWMKIGKMDIFSTFVMVLWKVKMFQYKSISYF